MRYVNVSVDVEEVLGDIDDGTLIAAAVERDFSPQSRTAAVESINQIRAGKTDDAILTLERAFLPTWSDVHECEQQYKLAMGRAA